MIFVWETNLACISGINPTEMWSSLFKWLAFSFGKSPCTPVPELELVTHFPWSEIPSLWVVMGGNGKPWSSGLSLLEGTSPLWACWGRGNWSSFILSLPYLRRDPWPSWLYLPEMKFLGHRTGEIRNNGVSFS